MCPYKQHNKACGYMFFSSVSLPQSVWQALYSFILLLSYQSVFPVVPHITDAIQEWVMKQARISVDDDGVEPQVCVIEVSFS